MILPKEHSNEYLHDYRDGKILQGVGIGCGFDEYYRYKQGQFNIVLGHDGVGKTDWLFWYLLVLSTQIGKKWIVWAGENASGQMLRKLIQWYSGVNFMNLSHQAINDYEITISKWFEFVDNKQLYKPEQLLDVFKSSDADGCFIDPYTGLDREFSHAANYTFLNQARQFCNNTGKTLYLSTHPTSESGRALGMYPQDHHWFGYLKPPLKGHIEGGKPFTNRVDDMLICHRMVNHPDMKTTTMIEIVKIKDLETGGAYTGMEQPVLFEFNRGLGFKMGGIDPIKRTTLDRQTKLNPNDNF